MAFTFRADEPTCTVGIMGGFDPGIINGHVYGITVYGMSNTVYASLKHVKATAEGDVLTFERLSPDAHGIVKAVLAELDTHETKPAEPEPFDYDAYRQKLDATIAGMKRPGAVTVTWDRHSPFPVWAYRDAPQWREGEGNNP